MRGEAAAPEWNEQLSFVELFPPLTRGLRLQLKDDAPLVDVALATHVLDLRQISHPGRVGERIWQTRAVFAWALSARGPAPDGKPHSPLRKPGPPAGKIVLHDGSSLWGLTYRPRPPTPTLGLAPLTEPYLQLRIL